MSDKPEASDVQKRPPKNNFLFAVIILIILVCAAAFVLRERPCGRCAIS